MGKKAQSTPAEQSALIALQEELDAELAAVAARVREIEAQRTRGS